MRTDEQFLQTLIKLGLSILEARIYLALCNRQLSTAKELSILTKTAKPDTYRVLNNIQHKGLVEKTIEVPSRFKAVPLEESIVFLLNRKKTEYDDLLGKSELLIRSVKEKAVDEKPLEAIEPHFTMIPQREMIVKRINEAICRSEKNVDIYLSWKRLVNGFTSVFIENCERAWKRGVHFRIVVESPQEDVARKQAMQFNKKSPFCSIRFLPGKTKTVTGIYDQKEVFIIVNPEEDILDSPALWSNNQSLITAIQEYFDLLWLISMEQPNQELDIISDKKIKE
jgi:sugar-specific transcriptional regulator TrmB